MLQRFSAMVLLCVALLISSCTTPYQSYGFTGGFTETQLGPNIFSVHFNGNGFTSPQRASDFSLLRCAELTKEAGYQYFVIIEGENYKSYSQYTTPTRSSTTGSANVYGNTVYGTAKTTTTGGQTYNIAKPGSSNSILCFEEKPEGVAFDADFLIQSLKTKYAIE